MAFYRDDNDLLWKRFVSAKHIPRRRRHPQPAGETRDYPDGEYVPVEINLADPNHRWPEIIIPIAQSPD